MPDPGDSPRPPRPTDPRLPGGSIAGPGGPRDRNAVVIDTTRAVLLDGTLIAMVEPTRGGVPADEAIYALSLTGRINRTPDRAEILYLMDHAGAADLVAQIFSVASRHGVFDSLRAAIDARLTEFSSMDALRPVPQEGDPR